ncbi:MAG TPA: hypothetical protein VNK04_11975, partial [Gemmataceae bacterium]|nr:hypothetical protein [Gemmataceae bacterium]
IGNIDLEAPNTPAMDAPSPYQIVPRQPAPGLHGMRPGAPTMPGGMAPMPPGAAMPPRMPPGMPTPPALPTNLMPPQPQPPRPAGPVGQAPTTSDTQQVNYMPAGRPPTPAELAAQDTGAPPPEKKPAQRRGLFSWGSDKTK